MRKRVDLVGIVESTYQLEGTIKDWLQGIADSANPLLGTGSGLAATLVNPTLPAGPIERIAISGPAYYHKAARTAIGSASPLSMQCILAFGNATCTLSEAVYPADPAHAELIRQCMHGRYPDILVVICDSGAGRMVFLGSPLTARRAATRAERFVLNRVAAHVGSALRLRAQVERLDPEDSDTTEAIFKPDGKLVDARGAARSKSARERLRESVLRSERARGPLRRRDSSQALALWEALVRGRWSLVDRFDTHGTRMILAVENTPPANDPRGLSASQLRVADALGHGRTTKEIAYTFGVSPSAVNNSIGETRRKLSLRSRSEVAAFFASNGVRARLRRFKIGDESMAVGSYGICSDNHLACLTGAEQAIAMLLLQGATNAYIAEVRACSYNTVANHAKSIYAKLRVANRAGLAALLGSGP